MLDYRHQQFIFDAREKLDELAYGAHNLSTTAGLTEQEAEYLEGISRDFARTGDRIIAAYNVLRCMNS